MHRPIISNPTNNCPSRRTPWNRDQVVRSEPNRGADCVGLVCSSRGVAAADTSAVSGVGDKAVAIPIAAGFGGDVSFGSAGLGAEASVASSVRTSGRRISTRYEGSLLARPPRRLRLVDARDFSTCSADAVVMVSIPSNQELWSVSLDTVRKGQRYFTCIYRCRL
jgi:hypothetical protein